MDNTYVQGFMDKCAAAGYDAEALVKWAASPEFNAFIDSQKKGPKSPLKLQSAVESKQVKTRPVTESKPA